MEPFQQFEGCLRKLKQQFDLIGQNVFNESNYKYSKRFFVSFFLMASIWPAGIYTIMNYDQTTGFAAIMTMLCMYQVMTPLIQL